MKEHYFLQQFGVLKLRINSLTLKGQKNKCRYVHKHRTSNIEQGILKFIISSFDIRCLLFDIQMTLLSDYEITPPRNSWLSS